MRNIIALFLVGLMVLSASAAHARGGRDDCAPNSTDPDCKDGK